MASAARVKGPWNQTNFPLVGCTATDGNIGSIPGNLDVNQRVDVRTFVFEGRHVCLAAPALVFLFWVGRSCNLNFRRIYDILHPLKRSFRWYIDIVIGNVHLEGAMYMTWPVSGLAKWGVITTKKALK